MSFFQTFAADVIAFVKAVRGEGPNVCTGEDGREAVRLILAAYASSAEGSPVRLKDAPDTFEQAVTAP